MITCNDCGNLLLPFLYDLLSQDEREGMLAHVDQCGSCKAELERARRQQRILARAAKSEFPQVQFQPPASVVEPARAEPTPEPRILSNWRTFAIAAGVLLSLGLGGSGTWLAYRIAHEKSALQAVDDRLAMIRSEEESLQAEQRAALKDAETAVEHVAGRILELGQKQAERVAALEKDLASRPLNLMVSGPETLQPGAPNEYQIQTRSLSNLAVPARLNFRVVTDRNDVVYESKDVATAGDYRLRLPPTLPLKPSQKLSLEVHAQREGQEAGLVREELTLAPPLYLTHLATEKPMYRPGETVRFRSLTLERFSLKPVPEELRLSFTITNPNGEEIFRLDGASQPVTMQGLPVLGPDQKGLQGIGAGEFRLDPSLKGGEYSLTVREASGRFPEQVRKFLVNEYQNPRLNKVLDFTRKSYGPGDQVVAACKVSRAEGGAPVAHRSVGVVVQVDGQRYDANGQATAQPFTLQTDEKGFVDVRFKLPAIMARGLGTLALTFEDGGSIEALVRPIPIVLKKLQVEFFPEGGDLVAGVPNRVYFQVRTMLDKPAELRGRIVDEYGNVAVADVHTLHDDHEPGVNQGMGVFPLTPEPNHRYRLEILNPSGIEGVHNLPAAKSSGVVLSIPGGVSDPKAPLGVDVRSVGSDRNLLVGAYCRGRLMDHRSVQAKSGRETRVELRPIEETGGVFRVTVFEEQDGSGLHRQLTPVAERLVYRKPKHLLQVNCSPNKKEYVPGEKVQLNLKAFTEREEPAPAVLMVAVVDKSIITMADEKTYHGMPTHFYLATEIRRPEDLEYADFLLSSKPNAGKALDLLLGTQGWRRFAEQDPGRFRQQYAGDADRLLMVMGQTPQNSVSLVQAEMGKLKAELEPQWSKLEEEQARAQQALARAQGHEDQSGRLAQLSSERRQVQGERSGIITRLDDLWRLVNKARSYGLLGLAVVLLVAGVVAFSKSAGSVKASRLRLAGLICCLLGIVMVVPWPSFNAQHASRAEPLLADARIAGKRAAEPVLPQAAEPMLRMKGDQAKGEAMREELLVGGGFAGDAPAAVPAPAAMAQPFQENGAIRALAPAQQAGMAGAFAKGVGFGAGVKLHGMPLGQMDGAIAAPLDFARKVDEAKAVDRLQPNLGLPEMAAEPARRARAFGGMMRQMPALEAAKKGEAMRPFGFVHARVLRDNLALAEEELERKVQGGEHLGLKRAKLVAPPPLMVREYAHVHKAATQPGGRSDFVDTVFWQPALVMPNGQATLSFDLCDSVTSYQVAVFAHTLDGRLGALDSTVEARLPLTLEPKLPIEVTASDKVDVPVSIANNTSQTRTVSFRVSGTNLLAMGEKDNDRFSLAANARTRRVFRFQPSIVDGQGTVEIDGESEPFHDTITRSFRVVPDGFPINGSYSDVLEKAAEHTIVLPETWIADTLKLHVSVYPSTLADLQKGLESLLREPCGCFEQTSSSNYPNVLILDYLRENKVANAGLERRAKDLLASGYQKLTSFECLDPADRKRQGYEWFGGTAPPHEALTAYGLLEFQDMARVFDVDPKMVARTRQYLLARRDGKGGFTRNPRALDSFGRAPEHITNAYIVWTLTESGQNDDLEPELKTLAEQASTSKDPYFLSLVSLSHINLGRPDAVMGLLKKLVEVQQTDGHLSATETSITGSGGRDLEIETTALAVLAWLKANRPADFTVALQKSIKWIGQQRGGYGGFGSTQSTILALKALIAYTRANRQAAEDGEIRLIMGQKTIAHQSFRAVDQETLLLEAPEPEKILHPGKNKIRVEMTGKNTFPYTLAWSYNTLKPASSDNYPVRLKARLDRKSAVEGEPIRLTVNIENTQDKGQGMAVAIVGLPAGVSLPEDMKQLKEHARLRNNGTEQGLISAWETRGRELILYWRDLAPRQKVEVPVDLICRVPGEYRGPASRAYLYYNADLKHWIEPLEVTIKARGE